MTAGIWLACLLLAGAGEAQAALGGGRDTIEGDRTAMKARVKVLSQSGFQVHDLTLPSGTLVREYLRADGKVFAVTWRGPARPDLAQVFGSYFSRFQSDNHYNPGHGRRRALSADHLDFVVRTGGHPGDFWGLAWLPMELPSGFSVDQLQLGSQ